MLLDTTYIVIIPNIKPYLFEKCEHPTNHCGSLGIMPITGGSQYIQKHGSHKDNRTINLRLNLNGTFCKT